MGFRGKSFFTAGCCSSCSGLLAGTALTDFFEAELEMEAVLERETMEADLSETSLDRDELRLLRALRSESLSESVFCGELDFRLDGSSSDCPRATIFLNLPILSSEECLARCASDSDATLIGRALGGAAAEDRSLLLLVESDRTERMEFDRTGGTLEVVELSPGPVLKSVAGFDAAFCFGPLETKRLL